MGGRGLSWLWWGVLCLIVFTSVPANTEDESAPWMHEPPTPSSRLEMQGATGLRSGLPTVEATIINAYRSANVGSEVGGIIESVNYDEGDFVKEGELVVQILKDRYQLDSRKANEKARGLETAVALMEKEATAREELLELKAATRLEVLKAQQQLEGAKSALAEAEIELKKALHDLEACSVKAPFTGYFAARLKQPYETAKALDPLFSLVDSERVYAVAYVPEEQLDKFRLGDKALFRHRAGREYPGVVDRIGKLIDPKNKAKKVYVLIENPEKLLELGMTGALQSVRTE